jgi:DNA-binding MarR family transcriptional regulator
VRGPIRRLRVVNDEEVITNWGLVIEGFAALSELMEADVQRTTGMPLPWFGALLRLYRTPGHRIAMSKLARVVNFTSGGFTKLVDRMTEAGLVERVASDSDRRVTYVALTEAGRHAIADGLELHIEFLRQTVLDVLGEERLRELGATMRLLRDVHGPDFD